MLVLPCAMLGLLAGCAVGPDFEKPAAPKVGGYIAQPLATTTATPNVAGGEAQRFDMGADLSGEWWTLFHSKQLNALIEQALANNHDLKAAQAALKVAHENTLAQRGAFFPSVAATFSASRNKQSTSLAPAPNFPAVPEEFLYNLYTPQLNISYTPDVFGLNRRTVESLRAQENATRFQMLATYTTLTSNVVVAAIQEAAMRAQIEATRELIADDTKMLQLLQYQSDKGYASGLDIAGQQSQLAQAKATLPPLVKQEAQLQHQLAVLTGRFPGEMPAQQFDLADLQLPQELPVSLPSTLVQQRPDVRQAQANLHAASAQVGVAIANRFPNIALSANAGSTALAIGELFKAGTGFWGLAADLTAPIFQGGTLKHQERAAKAAYTEASEQYKSTVLTAFQNVADTLTALQQDADALNATAAAEHAARTTLDLAQQQARDGYTSDLALLTAEANYQQARISLVQAQAERYADTAALFQALGGGWWHRTDLGGDNNEK
ncbi:MAG TPA: efflux transporter outer membrane subunit [Rhodanobacteraceae bacterium]|nr:efflux transporter outer membrane subunit [Rhodanobacteraceae bacterium]